MQLLKQLGDLDIHFNPKFFDKKTVQRIRLQTIDDHKAAAPFAANVQGTEADVDQLFERQWNELCKSEVYGPLLLDQTTQKHACANFWCCLTKPAAEIQKIEYDYKVIIDDQGHFVHMINEQVLIRIGDVPHAKDESDLWELKFQGAKILFDFVVLVAAAIGAKLVYSSESEVAAIQTQMVVRWGAPIIREIAILQKSLKEAFVTGKIIKWTGYLYGVADVVDLLKVVVPPRQFTNEQLALFLLNVGSTFALLFASTVTGGALMPLLLWKLIAVGAAIIILGSDITLFILAYQDYCSKNFITLDDNVQPSSPPWSPQQTNRFFQLEGDRIGMLTGDGILKVKQGELGAEWHSLKKNVSDFHLHDKRIGVLLEDGKLQVKDGTLSAKWSSQKKGVWQFQLEGNRIAVLLSNGTLQVKEGTLGARWKTQMKGVWQFQLEGTRIGVLLDDGTLQVKDGSLKSDNWIPQTSDVQQFQLEGNRIAVLTSDNTLRAKQGGLNAKWTMKKSDVSKFQLNGNRIAVLLSDGTLQVKEGKVGAKKWTMKKSDVSKFQLNGNRIGVLVAGGKLQLQRGNLDADWETVIDRIVDFQLSYRKRQGAKLARDRVAALWSISLVASQVSRVRGAQT